MNLIHLYVDDTIQTQRRQTFFVHIKQTTMICDYAFRGVIKNGKEKI